MAKILEYKHYTVEIFTDNPDVDALCELYWEIADATDGDKCSGFSHTISAIAKISGMSAKMVEKKALENSVAQFILWTCKLCSKPYSTNNRANVQKSIHSDVCISRPAVYLCSECRAAQEESESRAREKEEQEKGRQIRTFFETQPRSFVLVDDLGLREMIYFVSVMQTGGSEDLQRIEPPDLWEQKLSPGTDYSKKILKTLFDRRIIGIHPDTSTESIDSFNTVSGEFSYFPDKITYKPNSSMLSPDTPNALIQEILEKLSSSWTDETWEDEAYNLWFEIAIEECKEFLLFQMQKHRFDFMPGEKTIDYLTYSLKNYSVSQVFNIIWSSVQSAAALYQQGNITKKHAANVAISNIQSKTERSIANNWELKPYERNYDLPETTVSRLFYSVVLGLGDIGIKQKINREIIRSKYATQDNLLPGQQ